MVYLYINIGNNLHRKLMANLSLTEIRKRPGRIELLLHKLKTNSVFQIDKSSPQNLNGLKIVTKDKTEILYPKNKKDYDKAERILSKDATSKSKIIVFNDKNEFLLSKLKKTAEFGGGVGSKGNRGDMAEAIFGSAITARFINKNKPITESDVKNILKKINPNQKKQSIEFQSENLNKKIKDKVTFILGLSPSNLKALIDKSALDSLSDIIQSSVKYANSTIVSKWSKLLYENNKYNEIDVKADGISNQTGTKVDVSVVIDNDPVDINVSLKYGDIKQFGQISGSSFESQQNLFMKLLNIDIKECEKNFYKKIKEKDIAGSLNESYKTATEIFNKNLRSNKNKTEKNLSEGIKHFATLNEENVTLVQLSRSEAVVYKFDNLQKLLIKHNLEAVLNKTKAYPQIDIKSKESGDVLVSIRMKVENRPNGLYVRNYIEKGKLLTKISGELI